ALVLDEKRRWRLQKFVEEAKTPGRGLSRIIGRSLNAPQYQGRILRSEGDAVAHGMLYLKRTPGLGHVVQVAFGVRLFQIDGGRELVVLHRDQRGGDAGCAACPLRVADLRFQGRHRHFIGMAVESQLESPRLDAIVEFSGGAVKVYIVDIL